jgi:hypothetical protein
MLIMRDGEERKKDPHQLHVSWPLFIVYLKQMKVERQKK